MKNDIHTRRTRGKDVRRSTDFVRVVYFANVHLFGATYSHLARSQSLRVVKANECSRAGWHPYDIKSNILFYSEVTVLLETNSIVS